MQMRTTIVLVAGLLLASGCATSRRNKHAMQRSYSSGTTATVIDAPNDYHKNREQRVKGAFTKQ